MKRSQHVHRLQRVTLGKKMAKHEEKYEVYRCMNAGCTSYFAPQMTVGLITQCNACRQPFEFAKANLRQVKPKCLDCSGRPKDDKIVVATEDILKNLGIIK